MKSTAGLICLSGAAVLTGIGLLFLFPWVIAHNPMTARTGTSDKDTSIKSSATNDDVDYALSVQAERNSNHPRYPAWTPEWGNLIEQLQERGSLPAEKWEAYARESVDIRVALRGPARRGDPIPVRLHISTRLGPKTRFRIEYSEKLKLHGEIDAQGRTGIRSMEITSESWGDTPWFNLTVDQAAAAKLADGPQYITGVLDVSVFEVGSNSTEPLARRQIKFFESYSQWPKNQAAKKMTYGLSERQMLETGVPVPTLSFGRWRAEEASLLFGPVNLAQTVRCEVWIRAGEQEWQIDNGSEFVPGKGGNGMSGFRMAEFNAETVDVILRPAYIDEWYPYTVYPRDVSPYEVVFHNVSVQRVASHSTGH